MEVKLQRSCDEGGGGAMRSFWDFRSSITFQYNYIHQLGESHIQGVTKICLLSWLINSALVYEPKCEGRGGVAALRGVSQ